jgi:hypothetical protein
MGRTAADKATSKTAVESVPFKAEVFEDVFADAFIEVASWEVGSSTKPLQ